MVKTSHIGVILTITSGVCTRVRNHTTALTVAKTFHRKFISLCTYGVYTMVRSPTTVLLCRLRLAFREKTLSQPVQGYGFSPRWTLLM